MSKNNVFGGSKNNVFAGSINNVRNGILPATINDMPGLGFFASNDASGYTLPSTATPPTDGVFYSDIVPYTGALPGGHQHFHLISGRPRWSGVSFGRGHCLVLRFPHRKSVLELLGIFRAIHTGTASGHSAYLVSRPHLPDYFQHRGLSHAFALLPPVRQSLRGHLLAKTAVACNAISASTATARKICSRSGQPSRRPFGRIISSLNLLIWPPAFFSILWRFWAVAHTSTSRCRLPVGRPALPAAAAAARSPSPCFTIDPPRP